MFPTFRCNYFWFTTGRSSPARVARRFPGFALGDGAGLLRATCQPLQHSHYGVVDQTPWTDRPLLGGCGKVTSRPLQFQWVTKANLHMPYC